MILQLQDPEIRKKLTPTYEIGCKRITPHPDYVKVKSILYFASLKLTTDMIL